MNMIRETAEFLKGKIGITPGIGIILGTGLNSIAELLEDPIIIPYAEIPNLQVSTAPSHQGRLLAGKIGSKTVVILQGRIHYYEGYSMQEITFPIRVLKALGTKKLIVTNAAGSLNEKMLPGDIVILKDHINFMGNNPLIGENYPELGDRFPSLHQPYNNEYINLAHNIAKTNDFPLQEGVYTAVLGPSMETKAECKMLAKLGTDLVGMSTVPEVIVAIHSGIEVIGLSVVTNLSNIFHAKAHTQEEIRKNAAKAKKNLALLIVELVKKI
ncbi:MAG: purine-nucleoside phosphorylase [Candidatus Cloacimonetes bacterium]|nr:purine-nucleoside phosphorylase [Candidatus Cloacimonadota bacterium]